MEEWIDEWNGWKKWLISHKTDHGTSHSIAIFMLCL